MMQQSINAKHGSWAIHGCKGLALVWLEWMHEHLVWMHAIRVEAQERKYN